MSEARDRAVKVAKDILEMDFDLQQAAQENMKLQQAHDALAERLIAAQKGLRSLKALTQRQRGMRYEDMNVMVAYADQAIAVAEGRAPVAHLKEPQFKR